jgi:hypothetical protein
MNNGQCSRRPNWGGRRMLLAGLLSTISRLLRAADMDGRERESGERAEVSRRGSGFGGPRSCPASEGWL